MSKRKFIATLVLINLLAAAAFAGSLYVINDVLQGSQAGKVQGSINAQLDNKPGNSLSFQLGQTDQSEYFLYQSDGDITVIRVNEDGETDLFDYDLVDFLSPVQAQIQYQEGNFYFAHVGGSGNEIVSLAANKEKHIKHITTKTITSIDVFASTLVFLEVDKNGQYGLYQIDLTTGTSRRLDRFTSTRHYYIKAASTNKIVLEDISASVCKNFIIATNEMLDDSCYTEEETVGGGEYTITRDIINAGAGQGGYSVLDIPESYPRADFREKIFLAKEYKAKGEAAKPIYTGAANDDFSLISPNIAGDLLLLAKNEATGKGYLLSLKTGDAEVINLPQNTDFSYLGASASGENFYFDFYKRFANGRVSSLYSYNLSDKLFTRLKTPDCSLGASICAVHYLGSDSTD